MNTYQRPKSLMVCEESKPPTRDEEFQRLTPSLTLVLNLATFTQNSDFFLNNSTKMLTPDVKQKILERFNYYFRILRK